MIETWKDVQGYVGLYRVSDQGRVMSCDRIIRDTRGIPRLMCGRLLKQYTKTKGYLAVKFSKESTTHEEYVHAIVAHHFISARPDGYQVAHGNGDPSDNRAINLRWATSLDNAADRKIHGTCKSGSDHHNYKHGRYCR